jgi:hypothetical protein
VDTEIEIAFEVILEAFRLFRAIQSEERIAAGGNSVGQAALLDGSIHFSVKGDDDGHL